ncbi:MAG: AAA family ATPase, partial [Candidatus Zixiibacteriota bacterium]
MYLKQLDVLGFKSFAGKTNIHFANGMTAIVGPNGCGKTNILDAIRWVLGEQKVTLLRSAKMEEVIFNGTRDVKPLGMAEVTMTLVNDRGILPTEYNEVQVTRRLFRSGESEYLLNKVPCRLKDITELFSDTGVGAHSYSVIQQEMVDAVISDRAEERRFLFEEAAGITKYKQRRKAALRKLEVTEQDVLRLNDVYAEVRSQANSLRRQHRRAERYKRIADDIRAWDLYLGSTRLAALDTEIEDLKKQLAQFADRRLDREAAIDRLSAELETHRSEQVDLERQLTEAGNSIYEATERAHTWEKEITGLTEKRSAARTLIERNQSEIKTLQQRETILQEQSAEGEKKLGQLKLNVKNITGQLQQAENEQAEADRRLLEARSAKERENQRLLELEGKLSSGRTEGEGLQEQEEELRQQLEETERRLSKQQEELQRINQHIAQHRQEQDSLSS